MAVLGNITKYVIFVSNAVVTAGLKMRARIARAEDDGESRPVYEEYLPRYSIRSLWAVKPMCAHTKLSPMTEFRNYFSV